MSDYAKLLESLFGGSPMADAQQKLEIVRLKAKADECEALKLQVARLKRKSQWLIDRAYNKALDDMAAYGGTLERDVAKQLRRSERHADEFEKGDQ